MVLDIVKAGAPVLKEVAKQVAFVGRFEKRLLNDMAETMYASDGVGLAAPQINQSMRMIVVDDGNGIVEMINPVIASSSGEDTGEEGCLSCPGYTGSVKRFSKIVVEGLDRNMRAQTIACEGLLARIFQHEIDHLNGVLFTDIAQTVTAIEPEDAV